MTQPEPSPGGVRHGWRWRRDAYFLATLVTAMALFAAFPATARIAATFQDDGPELIPKWTWLSLAPAVWLLGAAALSAAVPDYSTAFGSAIALLIFTAAYAAMLGVTVGGSLTNFAVQSLELQALIPNRQAARWCFLMLCLGMLMTFLAGRMAARWRQVAWEW